MTPEFKYSIVSKNLDGNKSTARFTSAKSAYSHASRLKDEGSEFVIYNKDQTATVTLGNLRKQIPAKDKK